MIMPYVRKKFIIFFAAGTVLVLYYMFDLATNTVSLQRSVASHKHLRFDKDGSDVFVFVHVQKTGGTTMEKHFVRNIENSNCKCENTKRPSCNCFRSDNSEVWLLCRYNIPKWPCGLHPDFATLKECAPRFMDKNYGLKERRYFFGTILRHPPSRLLSEFRHVQRGASWGSAGSMCQGKLLAPQVKKCYNSSMLLNLDLRTFLLCKSSLAVNRQTWMHSNISLIGCDIANIMENHLRKEKLLQIAQENLQRMDYIALLEYPVESQFIFEKTFNLVFKEPFQRWQTGFASEYLNSSTEAKKYMETILKWNDLDMRIYDFAKKEFFRRYQSLCKIYGPPMYKSPSPNSSFSLNVAKKVMFEVNLPRSGFVPKGQ